MANFFTSSIGKKLIMSLAGLFLAVFLLVHLGINALLIISDDPMVFNKAANFMASNKLIKVMEIFLFLGLFLHMIYGVVLQIQNWMARPVGYAKNNNAQISFFSKYMIHTAVIIFVFLILHFMDFYFKAKFFHEIPALPNGMEDMASAVIAKFKMIEFVIIYIIAFIILGFHLHHAFQSAFQTFGVSHNRYMKCIKTASLIYSFIIVAGFSLIALVVYLTK